MGCGASEVSNSLDNHPHPNTKATVMPSSSTNLLNQRFDSNSIIPKRDHRTDTHEIIQNFLLIWLDENIDESSDDHLNSIKQLRRTINTIEIFHDTNECIGYMSRVQNEKSFLIISGALCESVVPGIHDMIQLHSIYVFCRQQERYEEWAKDYSKLAGFCNNIGLVYSHMGEYSKALSSYERSLEIRKIVLPSNHPDLAASLNSIGSVCNTMGEYSKALSSYERSLEIKKIALPSNHPDLATSYNNIGNVYSNMGEYSKALSWYERSLDIQRIALPPNHIDLAASYNNIGNAYRNMGEYSKALSSHERSLEIRQKALPPNHPDLAFSYNNIASVYNNMGEYSKALSFLERTLGIFEKSLSPNHPYIAVVKGSIDKVKKKM
ncbi:unnamed protein product [Rotaria sordida]|uniref:Kinesin light chain n=1 Tax=Rotaria sordida TaxID=392033 RepID=A0A816DUE2_9BILA|nr:unnamed protein product [Rotaria sordida]CAF1637468.1 unnamed protein product [Rotaria sordida]